MRSLFVLFYCCCTICCFSQNDLDDYLKNHSHSFSIETGFDRSTAAVLQQKLAPYRVILLGEGGSHFLQFYEPLAMVWLRFVNQQFGVTHFIGEGSHSFDILATKYLQTTDQKYLPAKRSIRTDHLLEGLKLYNQSLPNNRRLSLLGVDFERANTYAHALKVLMPAIETPVEIKGSIDLIQNSNDTLNDCAYILSINRTLQKSLKQYPEIFRRYLGTDFPDFEAIVMNPGSCFDATRNRNNNMADNFLRFHKLLGDKVYFGEFGMAHTILSNTASLASIINTSEEFNGKVCVINTYCYQCTTTEEPVSNWQISKIEKEILQSLMKYCTGNFTLLDFSGDDPVIKKLKGFGQFLVIAKDQR